MLFMGSNIHLIREMEPTIARVRKRVPPALLSWQQDLREDIIFIYE
jgi:hypothetical protein